MKWIVRWCWIWVVLSLPLAGYGQNVLPITGEPDVGPANRVFEAKDQYIEPGARVRWATYNIQDFYDGVDDGEKRTIAEARRQAKTAAALIDEIDPDIIVMQEIENAEVVKLLNAYFARPYAVAYVTQFGDTSQRWNKLNLAVLSRLPIEGATEINFAPLAGPGRPTRGLLRFTVPIADGPAVLVYVVHLKANWGDAERNVSQRIHALRILREGAAQVEGEHELLIMGDFNVDPAAESFASDPSLDGLNDLSDLWAGRPLAERITIPTRYGDPALEFPAVAFDRIYASKGLMADPWVLGQPVVVPRGVDTNNVFTIAGEDDTTASDHYPIYIDLFRAQE